MYDSIVIGAGQAGLAAGYHLQKDHRSFVILEASEQVGGSWPSYYDSLKLFSPAGFSSLPGTPFPGDPERYPTRDEVVEYLRSYALSYQFPIMTQTRVATVERVGNTFRVSTDRGHDYLTRSVIAATGSFHRPFMPTLPGQADFQGRTLHSAYYHNPEPFRGQRVIVVGGGNSAVQIAVELANVADVAIATRHPLQFKAQRVMGKDIHYWWWLTRFDTTPLGAQIADHVQARSGPSVLDTGVYQAAIQAGRPTARAMFSRFTPTGVVWEDGQSEAIDTVIFATGFRPNLDYLSPLGALDSQGKARHYEGVSRTTPGLYYVGLSSQRTLASATLRGVGPDAAVVVRHLNEILTSRTTQPWKAFIQSFCCPTPGPAAA